LFDVVWGLCNDQTQPGFMDPLFSLVVKPNDFATMVEQVEYLIARKQRFPWFFLRRFLGGAVELCPLGQIVQRSTSRFSWAPMSSEHQCDSTVTAYLQFSELFPPSDSWRNMKKPRTSLYTSSSLFMISPYDTGWHEFFAGSWGSQLWIPFRPRWLDPACHSGTWPVVDVHENCPMHRQNWTAWRIQDTTEQ
jgi:hypothetical protein